MTIIHNLIELLRPILGLKGWDYLVIWRLNEDQRSLEWMDCCCGGTQNIHNGDQQLFPVSSSIPCRDVSSTHCRTKSCELLAELPSIVPLDPLSGMYADTLMSNEAKWLSFSPMLESNISEESVGTRVLIPVPAGLVELFVAKQVPEDQQILEFIAAQCNICFEQHAIMIQSDSLNNSGFSVNGFGDVPLKQTGSDQSDDKDSRKLPRDVSAERIHLNHKNDIMFFERTNEMENGIHNNMEALQKQLISQSSGGGGGNMLMQIMEPLSSKEDQGNENESYKQENDPSNSASESDPNDDEDDTKYRKRNGKGPQSKNLMAERKRRKKLNDRLYALRALVPKISKLDRASILGDAIEYVKELQKQAKDLENELEGNSDDEDPRNHNIPQPTIFHKNATVYRAKSEHDNIPNGYPKKGSPGGKGGIQLSHRNQDREINDEKIQQMEPQVEVIQLDGNEFFVKVFCEHKHGGFVRLMEVLNSLGLEVMNVNATRHTCLVSYIFKVERKDCEIIQADDVRESLLELTRNPSRPWYDIPKVSENGDKLDIHQVHHHHHHHHHQMHTHHLHHQNYAQ